MFWAPGPSPWPFPVPPGNSPGYFEMGGAGSHGCSKRMATNWKPLTMPLGIKAYTPFARFGGKFKGHVTLQAMIDDIDIIPKAIDNGVADLVAGAGATTAGKAAQSQILRYYADKQRAYSRLMRAIIRRVLRVSEEVRARREAHAATWERGRGPMYIDAPSQPSHPESGF